MKFKYLLLVLVMALAFVMTGCEEKKLSGTSFDDTTEEASDATEEVTESTEAAAPQGEAAPDGSVMDMTGVTNIDAGDFDQMAAPKDGDQIVIFDIEGYGEVKIKMLPEIAPYAVKNFVLLAEQGYYDGLTFHRVINDFMIQGGDPEGMGFGGESIWNTAFYNEFSNKSGIVRGSLCCANSGVDPSNGSQFFITQRKEVTEDELKGYEEQGLQLTEEQKALYLENGGCPWLQYAHTVFGQVYEGMEIVDKIAAVETDENNKPSEDVIVNKVTVSEYKGK